MNIIDESTKKGSAYSSRRSYDKLFELPTGQYELKGGMLDTVRFIEQKQLLDTRIWKLFVEQFRGTPDDGDHGWRCEYWGKMMRGACFTYQCTCDEKLYSVLEATVIDLLSVQDGEGRFSTYSKEVEFTGWDMWGRKYVMLGLQYFYEICSDADLRTRIIEAVCRHADYIVAHIGNENGKKPIVKATNDFRGINSSSILEPFVRLYNITQKTKYLDFSAYIVNCGGTEGQNLWETAYHNKLMPYQYDITKAYEILSYFEGVLEFYRTSGVEKYRTAVTNFVQALIKSEITIIGGAGCEGEMLNNAKLTQFSTKLDCIMQETCVTVTWLKLCASMLALTGDSVYADCIETSAYNALRGAVNTEGIERNGGLPFDSYTPTRAGVRGRAVGGMKLICGDEYYGCCACIGSAGAALYGKYAVMASRRGFAVNFYTNGTVRSFSPDGKPFTMMINTDYPRDGKVVIAATGESEQEVALYLRIPRWSAFTKVTVDGKETEGIRNGSYLKFSKVWNNPCRIEIDLDMRTRLIRSAALPDDENAALHCAVRRGPLVMARDARLETDVEKPLQIICDEDNYIDAKLTDKTPFDTLITLDLPTSDGTVKVCDCSSAGKTWDEKSKMAIWMKTGEYK